MACGSTRSASPSNPRAADAAADQIVSSCVLSFSASVVADDIPGKQQREPSVAVDSRGAIWIADNDIPDPNAGMTPPAVMKVRRSTDGGRSFQDVGQPHCGHDNCGNPLLAVDSADRVFLTYGALDDTPQNPRWIYLVRVDDHPDNPHAAPLKVSDDAAPRADREWLAVGPADELYVAWKRGYHDPSGEIRIARSDDHGASFSASTLVVGNVAGDEPGYAAIAVDAKGVVKVAVNAGPSGAYSRVNRIVFTQSTDRGAHFSAPVDLHATPSEPPPPPFDQLGLYPTFPVIAVAKDGFAHVAWSQQDTADRLRIDLVVASSADGVVFGSPTRVNDDTGVAFHMQPALATDERGVVYATWLDSRAYAGVPPAIWKMFASYSRDRGGHFEPNIDLGTPLFPGAQSNLFGLQAVGEFNGMTTAKGSVYAAWTDTRTGDSAVYLAVGRCDP